MRVAAAAWATMIVLGAVVHALPAVASTAEVHIAPGGRATLLFRADAHTENYGSLLQLKRRLFEVHDDFDPVRAGPGCTTEANLVTLCRVPADVTGSRVVIRLGGRHDEFLGRTVGARFVVHGGDGDDLFSGLVGSSPARSLIDGGRGDDQFYGGRGPDLLRGGPGDDILRAFAGNDVIQPGRGRDRVFAGDGSDRIDVRDEFRDNVSCGRGFDRAWLDERDLLLPNAGCDRAE